MTLDDQDPRTSFLHGLDIEACRVEFSAQQVVLLCGGKVEYGAHPGSSAKSLRDAIAREFPSFELFRPEEITSWHSDGIFADLVSFEKELASICSLIVIILESEGALVELGAFSQLPELSEKIVAIRASKFASDPSFINLGIIRFITTKSPNSSVVKSYPWEIMDPTTISSEITGDVISDIQEALAEQGKTKTLKITNNSHVIVLICEFLRLFMALKENEIHYYLTSLGIKNSRHQLRGQLFLLTEFKLIKKQEYSDSVFYMRSNQPYHKLRVVMKDKNYYFDHLRFSAQCSEFYLSNAENHRNRNRAIALAKKGATT